MTHEGSSPSDTPPEGKSLRTIRAPMRIPALETFLRPLYQDLDGVSRFDDVERIARIARDLCTPRDAAEDRAFELLLLFHRLGNWLDKMGNFSRTLLATGGAVSEEELRRTALSIRTLATPSNEIERAVASAVLLDDAGLRGFVEKLSRARREGLSLEEVARDALAESRVPEWLTDEAQQRLKSRLETRRRFCLALLEELRPEPRRPPARTPSPR